MFLLSLRAHGHAEVRGLLKYQVQAEIQVQGSFFNDSQDLTTHVSQAYEWLLGSEPAPLHLLRYGETPSPAQRSLRVIFVVDTTRHRPYFYQAESVVVPIDAYEVFYSRLASGVRSEREDASARLAAHMAGALFGAVPELLRQQQQQNELKRSGRHSSSGINPSSRVLGERREYATTRAALHFIEGHLAHPDSFVNRPSFLVLREQFLALRSELRQKQSQDLVNFPHLQSAACVQLLAAHATAP